MNNIARVWLAAAFCIVALSPSAWAASVYEHGVFESVSLNGEWEMAYRPYAHEVVECPAFRGVKVRNAVPGYWEDMVPELRSSGMADEFRINPLYERQRLPISGSVGDTTLPNIYGCFLYRKSIDLKRAGPAVLAFEGVRNQVHVWINGMFVAYRAGFSTPFELEVKDGVLKVGLNEIVLAVSNNPNLGYCDYVSGLATRSTFASTGGVNGNLELRFPRNGLGDVYVTKTSRRSRCTCRGKSRSGTRSRMAEGSWRKARATAISRSPHRGIPSGLRNRRSGTSFRL